MDEGLAIVLAMVGSMIVVPILITYFILHLFIKSKQASLVSAIFGLAGAFVVGFMIPIKDKEGLVSIIVSSTNSEIVGYVITLGVLSTVIGLGVHTIYKRIK